MVKIFAGRSSIVFLVAVGAITMIASNFANNIAVCYVMMNIVASMYLNGFEVNILAASMLIAVCSLIAFYIPASSLGGAMMHSCEMTTAKDIYRYMPLSLLYFLVVLLTVFVIGGMIFG